MLIYCLSYALGWEHVELYAVIKGVPAHLLKDVVSAKLAEVGLSEYDGKQLSSGYSGGMKRKLSVACATIGAPQIVFLDEPSTGRYLWLSFLFHLYYLISSYCRSTCPFCCT